MSDRAGPTVAIVDYGMGNLFSVKHACQQAGLVADITCSRRDILEASAVILPGVGAFGVAIDTLTKLDLVGPLREVAASDVPLVGICLGMQLLMTESHEFGHHKGLGVIEGEVMRLEGRAGQGCSLKVPQVGWNQIYSVGCPEAGSGSLVQASSWTGTILDGLRDGEYMYFVHSFFCKPARADTILAMTRYGQTEFCSVLGWRNVFACQFHPERSGPWGKHLYRNLLKLTEKSSSR